MHSRRADVDIDLTVKTCGGSWDRHHGILQEEFDKGAFGMRINLKQK